MVAIAANRHVITFDQRGVGASSGTVPGTIDAAAADAYTFITALGHEKIDIFSFSMGFIAKDLVVAHPELVRLVLTGTGPRGGRAIDKVVATTYYDIARATITRSDPKEFLFFDRDRAGERAGKAFIRDPRVRRGGGPDVREGRRDPASRRGLNRSARGSLPSDHGAGSGRTTRQVLEAVARTRPAASRMSASAKAALRPARVTQPCAVTVPVSAVIGRRNDTLISRLVYPTPAGRVEWTAHPQTESRTVAKNPPCTDPMGL